MTIGPWTYGWDGVGGSWFIPEVGPAESPHGLAVEREEDARLIAAAPELLAELKELWLNARECADWSPECCARIDGLIAKAEGHG